MNSRHVFLRLFLIFVVIFAFSLFTNTVSGYSPHTNTGVLLSDPLNFYNGYTIVAPLGGNVKPSGKHMVYLVDMEGNEVHSWETGYKPGNYGFLTKEGILVYGGATDELEQPRPGGTGGIIQEIDWDGNVVWEYRNKYLHHDYDKMPNGNIMALVWDKMREESVERMQGGNGETPEVVWSDGIIEIDHETKEIIWEWYAQEELTIEDYPIDENMARFEWTHANSLDFLPEGNSFNGRKSILASFRQNHLVLIIDYETKEVTWEWGPGEITFQHDATLLENGNILVFDNGTHHKARLLPPGLPGGAGGGPPSSRVVEVNPETNEIVWQYLGELVFGHEFFSSIISGAQRLPNGNTLITEGLTGRVFEVATVFNEGDDENPYVNTIVWDYLSPYDTNNSFGRALFRSYRYGPDDVDWPQEIKARPGWLIFWDQFWLQITIMVLVIVSVSLNVFFIVRSRKRRIHN